MPTHTSSFKGIRWIFVCLLQKINVTRCVCVCIYACTYVPAVCCCVRSQLCQFTVKTCQPPLLSTVPWFPLSPSVSLLFPSIPLSDEQIELLNELFLWAPNAHPQLSICSFLPSVHLSVSLDSSIHLLPHASPQLICCNNVGNLQTPEQIHAHPVTRMHSLLMQAGTFLLITANETFWLETPRQMGWSLESNIL